MLHFLRRKLVPWAIMSILILLLFVAHLTYNRGFPIDSIRSLINGEVASSYDTEKTAVLANTPQRYGLVRLMFSLVFRC